VSNPNVLIRALEVDAQNLSAAEDFRGGADARLDGAFHIALEVLGFGITDYL
jgi:hypothetical protein